MICSHVLLDYDEVLILKIKPGEKCGPLFSRFQSKIWKKRGLSVEIGVKLADVAQK